MKTATELYPEEAEREEMSGSFYGPYNYQPMLNEFGNIVIQIDDDDYQGDSRVLYKKGKKYGYLQFGWGSCSGCDALQGCNTIAEVQGLMDELNNSIVWFDNKKAVRHYFETHDWKGDYSWGYAEQLKFVNQVLAYLGSKLSFSVDDDD